MVVRGDAEHVVPPSVDRFSPGSGVQRLQGGLLEAGVSAGSRWNFWGELWWARGRPVLGASVCRQVGLSLEDGWGHGLGVTRSGFRTRSHPEGAV